MLYETEQKLMGSLLIAMAIGFLGIVFMAGRQTGLATHSTGAVIRAVANLSTCACRVKAEGTVQIRLRTFGEEPVSEEEPAGSIDSCDW